MIVFEIHCNFFTVLPIQLKTFRSNVFLKAKYAAKKLGACQGAKFVKVCSVNDGDKNGWINDENNCGLKKYFLREIEFNG